MSREVIALDEALKYGEKLPFALIREESRLYIGAAPAEYDLNELIEARFFSDEQEVRIFRRGGELCASTQKEDAGEPTITQNFVIANPAYGSEIITRQAINYDSDGQAFLCSPRLAGWKEAN